MIDPGPAAIEEVEMQDEELTAIILRTLRDSKSPTLVRERLLSDLPEKHRHEPEAEPVPA